MASKKEIPIIDESMPLMDKNYENNELAKLNKPLILSKEYNPQKEEILKTNDVVQVREKQEQKDSSERTSLKKSSPAKILARVFGVDVSKCTNCGGRMKIISSIKEPVVIKKILSHLAPPLAPARSRELFVSR